MPPPRQTKEEARCGGPDKLSKRELSIAKKRQLDAAAKEKKATLNPVAQAKRAADKERWKNYQPYVSNSCPYELQNMECPNRDGVGKLFRCRAWHKDQEEYFESHTMTEIAKSNRGRPWPERSAMKQCKATEFEAKVRRLKKSELEMLRYFKGKKS